MYKLYFSYCDHIYSILNLYFPFDKVNMLEGRKRHFPNCYVMEAPISILLYCNMSQNNFGMETINNILHLCYQVLSTKFGSKSEENLLLANFLLWKQEDREWFAWICKNTFLAKKNCEWWFCKNLIWRSQTSHINQTMGCISWKFKCIPTISKWNIGKIRMYHGPINCGGPSHQSICTHCTAIALSYLSAKYTW